MNTRKLFFGFLAVAFVAMTVVSTHVISDDEDATTTNIRRDKKNVKKW